jgi:sarcosine oxidase subunit alpha
MMNLKRLPEPMGALIERDKEVEFMFEGKPYKGVTGDTIASALVANGQWLMSRSFKYHRARGPLTLAGQDANTLVQLPQEPNAQADLVRISSGMSVSGQNYNGTLENDRDTRLALGARFMPVGFYYRAFFKPKGSWNYWEPLIRKKAGLGEVDLTFQPEYHDKAYLFYDVAVIGGGPAGLSAALAAAEGGAHVLLVDEHPILGGALTYHRFDIEGQIAQQRLKELVSRVTAHPQIKVLCNAVCNGWFTDNYLPVIQGNRMYKVRARQCIVASGVFEQHVVFRNNDLPGIVMSGAAMRLMKHYAVVPGQRAVVLAGNDDGYLTALELADNGVSVSLVVDMRPKDSVPEALAQTLVRKGIPLRVNATVYEAVPSQDHKHLHAVDVREIVAKGQVGVNGEMVACDLLCMSAGYMPAYQLLCQAGATLSYDDHAARFSIANLPSALRIAGSVNGVHDLELVMADGVAAAGECLAALGLREQGAKRVSCDKPTNYPWPIFPHPKGKDFVDFDEDLQVKDIVNATKLGYRDIQLVKRFSTVGMGPSQGRHAALPTARLVADATGRTVSKIGVTTARPPFVPEKLAHVAGRIFTPVRQTPMHLRHIALGAYMIPAGNWRRPAFYGVKEHRNAIIEAEALNVRNRVGIIDVSTLGGLDIRGPDAAEFINRIYTFAFLNQPVGKTRYAVLTNEQGVVVDDGVACRIADEHFYVTATTTGVDAVYREMTRWNAQWRLEVDIANVTAAFSAVNIAGPLSRKVVEKVCSDVDFSNDAFPYLGYRQGTISGVPVRLLRVGFVGELGYEIHIPTLFGEKIWDILMAAGAEFDIQPFGVETQRLLRLEKGHLIIGQDTDGMSHPGELSLTWAVSRKKPFYVGCRSVDILMAGKQTRKLVGFEVEKQRPKPMEGHLVLSQTGADADITGHVTSCEYSPILNKYIGMAYVGIDQQTPGATIPIRVDDQMVMAKIATLPFYDPDNRRQEM